jgi:hypothetical protein
MNTSPDYTLKPKTDRVVHEIWIPSCTFWQLIWPAAEHSRWTWNWKILQDPIWIAQIDIMCWLCRHVPRLLKHLILYSIWLWSHFARPRFCSFPGLFSVFSGHFSSPDWSDFEELLSFSCYLETKWPTKYFEIFQLLSKPNDWRSILRWSGGHPIPAILRQQWCMFHASVTGQILCLRRFSEQGRKAIFSRVVRVLHQINNIQIVRKMCPVLLQTRWTNISCGILPT